MRTYEIKGELRGTVGKKASKLLRREEKIPCVLYGGEKNIHFSTTESDLRKLIYTRHVYLVNIEIDGKIYKAMIQDIQFHPVSDKVIHIDFQQVFDDKKIVIEIPVLVTGLAPGVKEGGKMHLIKRRLKVKALAKDLPDELEINVDNVTLGQTIKIGDVSYENLEMFDNPTTVVIAVKLTRAAKGMEEGDVDLEVAEVEEEATEEETEE